MAIQESFESAGQLSSWSFEDLARELREELENNEAGLLSYASEPFRELPSWESVQVLPEWSQEERLDDLFSAWMAGSPTAAIGADRAVFGAGWSEPNSVSDADQSGPRSTTVPDMPDARPVPEAPPSFTLPPWMQPVEELLVTVPEVVVADPAPWSPPVAESAVTVPEVIVTVPEVVVEELHPRHEAPPPAAAPPNGSSNGDPWLSLVGGATPSATHVGTAIGSATHVGTDIGIDTAGSAAPVLPPAAYPPDPYLAPPHLQAPMSPPSGAFPTAGAFPAVPYVLGTPSAFWAPVPAAYFAPPTPFGFQPATYPPAIVPPFAYSAGPVFTPPAAGQLARDPYPNGGVPTQDPADLRQNEAASIATGHSGEPVPASTSYRNELLPAGDVDVSGPPGAGTSDRSQSSYSDSAYFGNGNGNELAETGPAVGTTEEPEGFALLNRSASAAKAKSGNGHVPHGAESSNGAAQKGGRTIDEPALDDPFIVISSTTYMIEFSDPFTVCVEAANEVVGTEPWEVDASPLPQLYAMVAGQVRLTGSDLVDVGEEQVAAAEPEIYSWAQQPVEGGSPGWDPVWGGQEHRPPVRINGWTVVSASNDILPAADESRSRRRRR